MARHGGRDRCARLLAAVAATLLLVCAAPAGALPRRPGPPPLPLPSPLHVPVSVDELLLRRDRPDAYAAGRAECFAYVAQGPAEPVVTWYVFPRRGDGGRPRAVAGLSLEARAAVEAACGDDAARLNRVIEATCVAPGTLYEVLRSPDLLAWAPPELPRVHQWVALRPGTEPGAARELGCARVVDARDGAARLWIPLRERLARPGEAGAAGASVLRGLAFVQVRLEGGRVAVFRDRAVEDLHLDSLVEALEPLPGPAPRFLVLGARTFDGLAPGVLPRRYAFVMQVDEGGPRLVRGRFALREGRRDVLLLQGADPGRGDFRFHALRLRRLDWSPADGVLTLSTPRAGVAPATVARLDDGLFLVERGIWDATSETPGDARVWLSDRWGGVDEVGQRGFDEILGMRGGEGRARRAAAGPADLGPFAAR